MKDQFLTLVTMSQNETSLPTGPILNGLPLKFYLELAKCQMTFIKKGPNNVDSLSKDEK